MKKTLAMILAVLMLLCLVPASAFADGQAFDDIQVQDVVFYDVGQYTPSMYDSYQKGADTFFYEYFSAEGWGGKSLMRRWGEIAEELYGGAHSTWDPFGGIYDGYSEAQSAGVLPVDSFTGNGKADNILAAAVAAQEAIDAYDAAVENPAMKHGQPTKADGLSDSPNPVVYYYKGQRFETGKTPETYYQADNSYAIIFSDLRVEPVLTDDYLTNHVMNRADYQIQTEQQSSAYAQEFINESDSTVTSSASLETTVTEAVTLTDSSGTEKTSMYNVGAQASLRIGKDTVNFFGGNVGVNFGYTWGEVKVQDNETAQTQEHSTSATASMSVGLPPCTRVTLLDETGVGKIRSTPGIPMMVTYNVTIVYFYSWDYVQNHSTEAHSAVVLYCGDPRRSSVDGRSDLYQRVIVGAADPYGFKTTDNLKYDTFYLYQHVPLALANTDLAYDVTYTRNRMGDIQPLYNLKSLQLKDKITRLALKVDEPLDISTLEVEGLNLYNMPYYGFDTADPLKGGWFLCDTEGNHIEGNADDFISLKKNPATGKTMLSALKGGGNYVLRYEVAKNAYLDVELPEGSTPDPVYIDPATLENQAAIEVYTVSDDALPPEPTGITGIQLDSEARTMSVGEQAKLIATALPVGETDSYTYRSSNPSIAAVGDDGTITAKLTGKTTVTVTSRSHPDLFAYCVVTVVSPPSALTLSSAEMLLPVGGTGWLTAEVSPAGTPTTVSFTSNDESIATVNDVGLVTAVSAGTVIIRAETHNGHYDLCYVKVVPPASGIDAPDSITLGVGQTYELGANTALRKRGLSEITYRSMDPEIVTVDALGLVTAVQRGETAIVIQGVGNLLKTVPVTVKPAPDRISISPAAQTVNAADRFTVTVELPEGSAGTYSLASSDEQVARVSEDGLVTAFSKGKALITATAYNGITASCSIENLGVTEESNPLRLPASLMTVGVDAFAGTNARIVFLPDGAEVQKGAFADCDQLLIVVTGDASRIADGAFDHEILIVDSLE